MLLKILVDQLNSSIEALIEETVSEEDDDAPEIMHAQNTEILKLKQLHEEEEQSKAKKKRRKSRQSDTDGAVDVPQSNNDEGLGFLDDSILEVVTNYEEYNSGEEESSSQPLSKSGMGRIRVSKPKSKKM